MNNVLMNKINIVDNFRDLNNILDDNSYLEINYFNKDDKDININYIQKNNSTLVINYASYIKCDTKINIKVDVVGNNNKTIIKMRNIALNNNANINVVIKIEKDTLDNYALEDLKGINDNGSIIYNPILEIDTKNVNAEHFATIGNKKIFKNEIFYLMNKGINEDDAFNLLKKKFIYNIFDKEFKEKEVKDE